MRIDHKLLRKIIKEELALRVLSEQEKAAEEGLTNAEFTKALKTDAAALVNDIPTKFNDETAEVLQTLIAMSQHDAAAFQKMVNYADNLGKKALEKSEKESASTGTSGAAFGAGVDGPGDDGGGMGESLTVSRMQQVIKEEIAAYTLQKLSKK